MHFLIYLFSLIISINCFEKNELLEMKNNIINSLKDDTIYDFQVENIQLENANDEFEKYSNQITIRSNRNCVQFIATLSSFIPLNKLKLVLETDNIVFSDITDPMDKDVHVVFCKNDFNVGLFQLGKTKFFSSSIGPSKTSGFKVAKATYYNRVETSPNEVDEIILPGFTTCRIIDFELETNVTEAKPSEESDNVLFFFPYKQSEPTKVIFLVCKTDKKKGWFKLGSTTISINESTLEEK